MRKITIIMLLITIFTICTCVVSNCDDIVNETAIPTDEPIDMTTQPWPTNEPRPTIEPESTVTPEETVSEDNQGTTNSELYIPTDFDFSSLADDGVPEEKTYWLEITIGAVVLVACAVVAVVFYRKKKSKG